MKRILYLAVVCLLLIAPFVLTMTSCEDKDKLELKTSEVKLSYQNTYQIVAKSDDPISYTSENEYHATVSKDGLLKAGFVGETNILLNNGKEAAKFKVIVEPMFNTIYTPFIEWETTQEAVIKEFGTDGYYNQKYNTITYVGLNTKDVLQTIFLFDKADKLNSTGVYLDAKLFDSVADYLYERYAYYDSEQQEDGSYIHFFGNALNYDKADLIICIMEFDNVIAVVYMPKEPVIAITERSTKAKKMVSAKIIDALKKAQK